MRSDNQLERIAQLERTVEELRRQLLQVRNRSIGTGATHIISVELAENIGATTTDMADCNVLDWDGSADADSGENVDVYDWPSGASDLTSGDTSRALFSRVRNRWEFLLGGGGSTGTLLYLGKTDAAINKGSSGTVSIWTGTPGSESDSTSNLTSCQNKFADVDSGKWVMVAVDPYGITGNYLIAAEC